MRRAARQVGRTVGRVVDGPSIRARRGLLVVGVAALVAAAGVALLPAGVVAAVVAPLAGVATRTVAAVVAVVVGLLAATAALGGDDDAPAWDPGDPPERAHVDTRDTVGRTIDDPLDDLRGDLAERERVSKRWRVRSRVSAAAVEVLVAEGYHPDAARDLLAAGDWTDDVRAAAFLGDVRVPVAVRVRDWLAGDPFGRRAAAAIGAVETRAAAGHRRGRVDDGRPPADEAPDAARYGSLAADLGVDGDATSEREAATARSGSSAPDAGSRNGTAARAVDADAATDGDAAADGAADDDSPPAPNPGREAVEEVSR